MPSLLIVDDDRTVVGVFQRCFQNTNVTVHTSGSLRGAGATAVLANAVVLHVHGPGKNCLSALEEIRESNPTVPVVLVAAAAASDMAIESMRLGAMDFLTTPLDVAKVREVIGRAIHIGAQIRLNGNRKTAYQAEAASIPATSSPALLGTSPAMQEVYKSIGRVAGQNINVLISGESGTGKELVAHAIHQHSNRADRKFLAVNCAAIPESLLESELFGHEKGSFTGAAGQRIGKFEECDGGTLFLDKVGDMPLLMQSKVLRAIQEKEFQRVGGNQTITADVRIVAATNRDLEAMVLREEFRADLSFRLNGYHIALPGLRERREDVPLLVEHYLRLFDAELRTAISAVAPEAMNLLVRHDWPGNVRECRPCSNMPCFMPSGRRCCRNSFRRSSSRRRRPIWRMPRAANRGRILQTPPRGAMPRSDRHRPPGFRPRGTTPHFATSWRSRSAATRAACTPTACGTWNRYC